MGKKKKEELEERILWEELKNLEKGKDKPAVKIIRPRPVKLTPIAKESLTEEQLRMSSEWSEIEDLAVITEDGTITITVDAGGIIFWIDAKAPKTIIHHLIDEYLDRYGKRTHERFRTRVVKEGFEIYEEVKKKGKSLLKIVKERHNLHENPAYSDDAKAKYEKARRRLKKFKD